MSILSQAKQERQRKTLQREILRAQTNAKEQTKGTARKRDWGSIVLVALIVFLVVVAAFLFWFIASGRVNLPSANAQQPAVQPTAGEAEAQMDNAWQENGDESVLTIDPNYVEDTVFIGDSNTVRLWTYEFIKSDHCLAQDSVGVGAVTQLPLSTSSSNRYGTYYGYTILESIEMLQPKRVVMTFGTNDIGGGTVESFIQTYRSAINAIREVSDCEIIVNSIFPARQWNDYPNLQKESIEKYNRALENMCSQEGISFLNSYEALAGEDGWCDSKYTIEDGVHLNEYGLQAFLDYYRSHAYTQE